MDQSAPLDGQSVVHTIGAWPTAPWQLPPQKGCSLSDSCRGLYSGCRIEPSGKLPSVQGKWEILQNNPPPTSSLSQCGQIRWLGNFDAFSTLSPRTPHRIKLQLPTRVTRSTMQPSPAAFPSPLTAPLKLAWTPILPRVRRVMGEECRLVDSA